MNAGEPLSGKENGAIESVVRPEWIGWWVISGDLPTDCIPAADISPPQHPRKAILAIAERWLKVAEAWSNGHEYAGFDIGGLLPHEELAPLLAKGKENGTGSIIPSPAGLRPA